MLDSSFIGVEGFFWSSLPAIGKKQGGLRSTKNRWRHHYIRK